MTKRILAISKALFPTIFLVAGMMSSTAYSYETLSVSPDGIRFYECGDEKNSVEGCHTFWLKEIRNGDSQGWRSGYCINRLCYQGGVAWWYWKLGNIGDSILKGFVQRDYQGPNNESLLGDAKLISRKNNCYLAANRTFCMVPMK